MKNLIQKSRWLCMALLCVMLLNSCEERSTFEFKKTKESSNKVESFTSIQGVQSYSLVYNPNANGIVIVTLSDGSEYSAPDLNASQMSSLLVLLKTKGLQFDTKNNEFRLTETTL